MSTLNVVEKVLRERGVPMVVREIVEAAGPELPTKSRTPDTVVARDLAMDIKKKGEASKFCRTSPGKYTLRELAGPYLAAGSTPAPGADRVAAPAAEVARLPVPPVPPVPPPAPAASAPETVTH